MSIAYLHSLKYLKVIFLTNCLNILVLIVYNCGEQFCFRPDHSTELASKMEQHHTNQYFLGISKEFNIMNHEMLLNRLAYGVKGSINKLLPFSMLNLRVCTA